MQIAIIMHTPTLPENRGISSLHKKKEHEFKEAWLDLHHCARHKDGQCMYQVQIMETDGLNACIHIPDRSV